MISAQPPSVAIILDAAATGTKFTHIMLQDEITRHMNKIETDTTKPGTEHQFINKQS